MKKLLIAIAAAATAATSAWAQADRFKGFGMGVSAHFAQASTEVNATNLNGKSDRSSTNFNFEARYLWALSPNFLAGGGISMDSGKLNSDLSDSVRSKETDALQVFAQAGIPIGKNAMVFGKLAYLTANGEYRSQNVPLQGMGYGIGMQYAVTKNWHARAEWLHRRYNEAAISLNNSSLNYSTRAIALGVAYQF